MIQMRKIAKGMAIVTMAAAAAAPVSLAIATPAFAQSSCSAGTWGGVWGWGDCRGSGQWQLKVSCTWGGDATSAVLSGPGHVDVKCPWGSARTASIIYR
ncbi:hypothetical protein BS329_17975 [Amycolatopsis coloradensis]|uniref:Uncharacterized protein n=1 Tax=Amycolatopsis coloradensis TaxID=76021 RepID=A0A1R0KTA4_9PSEU|nr:hypothetical protein [Amycolatopsis coloradensis]OLZ51129.1 hypothetical protein BS329_17975 [Amycolatopsis coloradensis]